MESTFLSVHMCELEDSLEKDVRVRFFKLNKDLLRISVFTY